MASWTEAPQHPFGTAVERVPLSPNPLVQVVVQVRFPPVLSVSDQRFVAPFQEAIRSHYPLIRREAQRQVAPGPDGQLAISESALWHLTDTDDTWQVSLSQDFISLTTTAYCDRSDLLERIGLVLDATEAHIKPVLAERVGTRYTDRLDDPLLLERLDDLVRPELLGLSGTPLGNGSLAGQLSQADFTTGSVHLRGRWGQLPAGATHDPAIAATANSSWVLDLDAYRSDTTPFAAKPLVDEISTAIDIIYGFFRWVVSDEFLTAHGAAT